jgi:cell division protease FtsH
LCGTNERKPFFLEVGYKPPRAYSEETAHEIDEEVKKLINDAYEKSKILLESKRSVIERIAKILLEKEVLEGDELRRHLKEENSVSGQPMAA